MLLYMRFSNIHLQDYALLHVIIYVGNSLHVQSTNGTGDTIMCTPSPGIAYVGSLPTAFNGVSGDLFIRNNKTFVIRDFNYDGAGRGICEC